MTAWLLDMLHILRTSVCKHIREAREWVFAVQLGIRYEEENLEASLVSTYSGSGCSDVNILAIALFANMIPWTLLTCSLQCGVVVAEVFWQMKFTNRRQVDVAKNWTLYCQSFSSMSKQTAEGLDAWIHLLSRSITKIFIQSYQLDLWILLWSFFCCLGQYCGWWCRISRLGTTTTTAQGWGQKMFGCSLALAPPELATYLAM